ncbi:MAG: hypothetical protein RLZZ71_157 [Bacteroidota bacterium]|jgi:hypothetical protein
MIGYLTKDKKTFFLFVFHVLLGIVSAISKFPLIIYVYYVLLSSLPGLLRLKGDYFRLNILIAYVVPLEILSRMTETSPFIPYEFSKYLMFLLLLYGILKGSNRGKIGFVLLSLLLPALFFDLSGEVTFKGLVFNVLAPINLCLGVIYFYKNAISSFQLYFLMRAILFPLISALFFVFFKTPNYDTIEFALGAIHDTTGGFGPNQVATIFGLGLFLMFFLINKGVSISGNKLIDIGILFLFVFQGLLSFSRGGMIGGFLAIIGYYVFSSNTKVTNKISLKYVFPILVIMLGSFWIANEITNGQLALRYLGETAGTQLGSKEKDLNTLTTGRASIFEADWDLFQENHFGVGAGASSFLRNSERGVLTHTELSRLLAEHGYLGIFFFLIISILPFIYFRNNYSREFKGFMIALYFLAWYTSFHAATRNFVTPLLIGMALMHINPDKLSAAHKKIAA